MSRRRGSQPFPQRLEDLGLPRLKFLCRGGTKPHRQVVLIEYLATPDKILRTDLRACDGCGATLPVDNPRWQGLVRHLLDDAPAGQARRYDISDTAAMESLAKALGGDGG